MPSRLTSTVGSPVEGEGRFWDRQAETALMEQWIREGRHILLTAQRRMGKSSLMRETARRLSGEFLCLEVDLQSHQSPADTVAAIAARTYGYDIWQAMKARFGSAFQQLIGGVERVKVSELELQLRATMSGDDWQRRGDAVLGTLAEQPRPVVLFLDEVPILVNRMLKDEHDELRAGGKQRAEEFLSWLRASASRHAGKIRTVITGSIGLEPILHRARLSATINHLAPFELRPWDRDTALGCLDALAAEYGIEFGEGAQDAMLARLGSYVPHHVQVFFDLARTHCHLRHLSSLSPADVESVYRGGMLGPRGHSELSHYEERLRMVLGPDMGTLAAALLTRAARRGTLTLAAARKVYHEWDESQADADRLAEVIAILQHDGYLRHQANGSYAFESRLLQDWWQARFGSWR